MDLVKAIKISASGMQAQGVRMRIISENLANAGSLGGSAGEDPYRRKTVTFKNELDRTLGARLVKIHSIGFDKAEFGRKYDPHHPAADEGGYVSTPNVNGLVEVMDMREARRSYEANLNIIEASKRMLERTIDILRN